MRGVQEVGGRRELTSAHVYLFAYEECSGRAVTRCARASER